MLSTDPGTDGLKANRSGGRFQSSVLLYCPIIPKKNRRPKFAADGFLIFYFGFTDDCGLSSLLQQGGREILLFHHRAQDFKIQELSLAFAAYVEDWTARMQALCQPRGCALIDGIHRDWRGQGELHFGLGGNQ